MSDLPPFQFHVALEAFEKAGDSHPMRIGGLVSSDSLDSQGERILQDGLDFSDFLRRGWYNDNHKQGVADVVGYPVEAKYVSKGDKLPHGKLASRAGWWTEGYLVDTTKGKELWGLAQSLNKGPRRLGFSIEGKVIERDRRSPNIIKRAAVRNVAVTHCPVNTDTELLTLTKALVAGSAVANPGASPGSGFALRTESLDHKGDAAPDRSLEDMAIDYLAGDGKHMLPENGGDGHGNPHVKKSGRAETDSETPMDEVEHVERFAPFARSFVKSMAKEPVEDLLTRSEARSIIRERFPFMPAEKVEVILAHAARRPT